MLAVQIIRSVASQAATLANNVGLHIGGSVRVAPDEG